MSPPYENPKLKTVKLLNLGLNIIIFILIITVFLMMVCALSFVFDTGLKQSLIEKFGEAGGAIPSNNMHAFGYLAGGIIAAAYLYVAIILRRITQTTLKGNPFVALNITRLRTTWVVLALVEFFRMFSMAVIEKTAHSSVQLDTALTGLKLETRLSAWFLIFIIAVMAEVFRIGLELKRDQELTV